MKRNWLLLITVGILTFLAGLIAIPTISFDWNGTQYSIRGLDPKDVNQTVVTEHFTFQNSLDFVEGSVVTIDFNFNQDGTDNVIVNPESELNKVVSILYWRLWSAKISDFKINTIATSDPNQYKIMIKVPEFVDIQILRLLLSPGYFELAYYQESETNSVISLNITNQDIESVNIVSDSRCIGQDYQNYCLSIIFKENAQTVIAQAILAQQSIIAIVNGAPVAYQSAGQIFNPVDLGKELILAPDPNFEDRQLVISMLASLIRIEPLPTSVEVSVYDSISPILGDTTLPLLKVALVMGVVSTMILVGVFFKKFTKLFITTFVIYYIWSIALFKVMNLVLGFSFLGGYMIASAFFFVALIISHLRLIELAKGGISATELKEVYNWVSIRFRNITILIIVVDFILTYMGTLLAMNFVFGLGAGMVTGLLTIVLAFKAIAPFILLKK